MHPPAGASADQCQDEKENDERKVQNKNNKKQKRAGGHDFFKSEGCAFIGRAECGRFRLAWAGWLKGGKSGCF